MRNPEEIVLRALSLGLTVELGPLFKVQLDDEQHPCQVCRRLVLDQGRVRKEDVLIRFEYSLSAFIRDCRRLSKEQLAALAMDIVLNELKGKKS